MTVPTAHTRKTVGIHQPNFFPWLGYFHKMAQSDVFVLLDTVDIVLGSAKSITHRTRIKTPQGVQWLGIPLQKQDTKLIKDLLISPLPGWQQKMLETLARQYGKTPYWKTLSPFVEECLLFETDSLSVYNVNIIRKTAQFLGIHTPLVLASELPVHDTDRNGRLISICSHLGASIYLSGKGGMGYHDTDLFAQNNVEIQLLDYQHPVYPQPYGDFVPGLSVLDFLFNTGGPNP